MEIVRDGTTTPAFGKRYDSNGKVWIYGNAPAGATKNTPYMMYVEEDYYRATALADNVHRYYVGVPDETVASGDYAWFQIGGRVTALITPSLSVSAGHALKILDGAVADAGSDYNGITGSFAVCKTASTTSTTQDAILVPELITATT